MTWSESKSKGYVTDRFGDAAIRFLEDQVGKAPFLLFVSFTAPHGPLQAKEEDLETLGRIKNRRRRRYAGLIKSLDSNVGRILDALKATGLDKNTLVIFTNDNGGQTSTGAVNAPLRGRKGQLWEGGIRVPMCMRWPGKIKAGSRIDESVISLDFLPTFVEMAGGQVDVAWKLDGVSLLPRLLGDERILSDRVLYWRKGGPGREIALRRGRYNLHFSDRRKSDKPELYDLIKDIGESHDIAAENEDLVKKLCIDMQGWEKQLEDPRWGLWSPPKKVAPKPLGSASRALVALGTVLYCGCPCCGLSSRFPTIHPYCPDWPIWPIWPICPDWPSP